MVWILGDKALAMVLGLLIFGMIGRALGPVGAGHFAFAAALLQVALGLSLVCSASGLLPRFCRMNAALPGAIANVFAVRMAASLASLAAVSVYCLLVIDIPERRTVSMVLLLAVPLIEPFAVIAMYWNSRNHNRPNVIARASGLLARTAMVALGIAVGAGWWLLAMAWVLEAAINAFIQTLQLRQALPARPWLAFISKQRCKAYLRFGARFVVGSWLHVMYTRLDRLLLAERMPAEAFGLYATAMQLMDVWIQVASLIAVSLATAYLYRRIRAGSFMPAFFGTAGLMAAVGLTGLAGAWLFGPMLLRLVFGAPFVASQPFLLSGSALAVLLFANQIVQLTMSTLDRPMSLVVMWVVAVVVAVPAIVFGYDVIGAHAGPAGLAVGLLAGWISLIFTRRRSV
jgi:PST family polysaccharide transporter